MFCRFTAILKCDYAFISDDPDLQAVFRGCVTEFAKNATCARGHKVSWADSYRELLVHAYIWLLYHYDQGEAHRIHRNIIVHSLFWLAFAKSVADRSCPGRIAYNPVTWMKNMTEGKTAMKSIRDPRTYADKLFSTLGGLFDDIRLQRLAVGTPCRDDCCNQEDEIVSHLAKLANDKRNDRFPLPASIPNAIFVLPPTHPWWTEYDKAPREVLLNRLGQAPSRAPELEEEESDMDTTAPESTDTEMYRTAERQLLISSDRQAYKVQNVVRIQRQAAEEARSHVQSQFYEVASQDTRRVHLKRESETREQDMKCRTSPPMRPRQEERGRSILKKRPTDTMGTIPRKPRTEQEVPRGVGSPLTLAPHLGVRTPTGTTPTYHGSPKQEEQTAFSDALRKCYTDYVEKRSRSRKREHLPHGNLAASSTPTQSPAQKSFKLQSTVTVPERPTKPKKRDRSRSRNTEQPKTTSWRPECTAPYHLIGVREVAGEDDKESEKDLILYFMNRFSWDHYGPELGDFGNAFGGNTVYATRFCMAAALYFEVAWARGERWIFPVIPDKLTKTSMRHEGKIPKRPTCSRGRHADELRVRCREWWMYFLALLQSWKDETCAFDFGGALRPDSKVMLFVYWHVKEVFKRSGVTDFHLYQVRNRTDWAAVRQRKFTDDEITAEWEKHKKACTEMADCKEWMNRRYEAEAILEYSDLLKSDGDFDALAERRVDPIRRPGDENQFHKERQAEERRKEERRKGAPGAPRSTVDAERQLERQRQSEEHQSYSRQRAEEIRAREGVTSLPITYDVSSPAASTLPVPVKQKKKISWAEHQARVSKEPSQPLQENELADLDERIRKQQVEVDYYQREVDRLRREQEELAREQERMRYEQDRLEQERLRDLELVRRHELEAKRQHELARRQRHERRRQEKEEELDKQRAEQERLATANQDQFG